VENQFQCVFLKLIVYLGKVDELTEAEGTLSYTYVVGESVKVINGPFNGFNGIIEEINEEKKKIKVTVKIFGRKTPVEVGFGEVEKNKNIAC
jgi:transcriptional antiterminator NusG